MCSSRSDGRSSLSWSTIFCEPASVLRFACRSSFARPSANGRLAGFLDFTPNATLSQSALESLASSSVAPLVLALSVNRRIASSSSSSAPPPACGSIGPYSSSDDEESDGSSRISSLSCVASGSTWANAALRRSLRIDCMSSGTGGPMKSAVSDLSVLQLSFSGVLPEISVAPISQLESHQRQQISTEFL